MDYNKLHWHSDWTYSEVYGKESEYGDIALGLYSIKDFPDIHMYIDTENEEVIDVWLMRDKERCFG